MPQTMVEEFTSSSEGMADYQQERAILEVTILIRKIIKEQKLTKSDLADRMGRTKAYVTQLLDGRANMTLRTIADVMTALRRSIHFSAGPLTLSAAPPYAAADRRVETSRSNPPTVPQPSSPEVWKQFKQAPAAYPAGADGSDSPRRPNIPEAA